MLAHSPDFFSPKPSFSEIADLQCRALVTARSKPGTKFSDVFWALPKTFNVQHNKRQLMVMIRVKIAVFTAQLACSYRVPWALYNDAFGEKLYNHTSTVDQH